MNVHYLSYSEVDYIQLVIDPVCYIHFASPKQMRSCSHSGKSNYGKP